MLFRSRFDRQIALELPDLKEREQIFGVHTKELKLKKDVNLRLLAKQTPGFSGADIANACNEAALIGARNNHKKINRKDFADAIDRIVGGLEKKNKIISKQEKEVIAFHESGHASVSWMLQYAQPLVKVTIVPRGKALGASWYLPEERQITTYDQMFDEITAALGGRAAEEIMFNKVSTGALNDLERVTKQAYAMVSYFGLNKRLGNISYYDSTGQSEYSFTKPYSEKTAEAIDEEISSLVEKAYKRAKEILTEYKEQLTQLSSTLLSNEVIFRDDLERIFGKRHWGDKEEDSDILDAISKANVVPAEDEDEADSGETREEEQKDNSQEEQEKSSDDQDTNNTEDNDNQNVKAKEEQEESGETSATEDKENSDDEESQNSDTKSDREQNKD